jgi:hypothetical protein
MKRNTIDKLLVSAGIVVLFALLATAGLAAWGHSFATSQVQSQLVQEKVYFPPKGSPSLDPAEFPSLQKYAGQQVDSGDKAKAYADDFIWVHMMKVADGKTYAQVSALAQANPTNAKLAAQKTTLFQGDMLRSSLLTAYAFSRFGVIAQWAQTALLGAGVVMAVLVLLGFNHLMMSSKPTRSKSKRRK